MILSKTPFYYRAGHTEKVIELLEAVGLVKFVETRQKLMFRYGSATITLEKTTGSVAEEEPLEIKVDDVNLVAETIKRLFSDSAVQIIVSHIGERVIQSRFLCFTLRIIQI